MRSTIARVLVRAVPLVLIATAASDVPRQPEQARPGALSFRVVENVRPAVSSLDGPEGRRPVSAVRGPDGSQIDFVNNELLVTTDDRSVVEGILRRWRGRILRTDDPADFGLPGLEAQHLVRIDAPATDVNGISADLSSMDPAARGRHVVSDPAGLRAIAIAAREQAGGVSVGLNFLSRELEVVDRDVDEATTAAGGPPGAAAAYVDNPYAWSYMRIGGVQDIGVAEAWRMLELADRASRVRMAIIDSGWAPGTDLPSGWARDAASGGNPVLNTGRWHGTKVAFAAAEPAGNFRGGAGSGAPVVEPYAVESGGDIAGAIRASWAAYLAGARIINFSVNWAAPATLTAGSVSSFDNVTKAIARAGVLIFSSAGNDGDDVDATDCLGACWEETWHVPCENEGVLCVGGLAWNQRSRDPGSNHGNRDVDLWGPYTVYLGATPDVGGSAARVASGTSFSSPFVAGVAALVWAADPKLDPAEVWRVMRNTAHPSSDPAVARTGYVNAWGAVYSVLSKGKGIPPHVEILKPKAPITIVPYGVRSPLRLRAVADDYEGRQGCTEVPSSSCHCPKCEVEWSSDADGRLGAGPTVDAVFDAPGERAVRAVAVDAEGNRSKPAIVRVKARNEKPDVRITEPINGERLYTQVAYVLQAASTDVNEGRLACERLEWRASVGSDLLSSSRGCTVRLTMRSAGEHSFTVTGVDEQGAPGVASVRVLAVEPPPNAPPVVSIRSPSQGQHVGKNETVRLDAEVTDPDGDSATTYRWLAIVDGSQTVIGTSRTMSWVPSEDVPHSCSSRDVTLRLEAEDGDGVGSDAVDIVVVFPPC